jgi:hypothetical protein
MKVAFDLDGTLDKPAVADLARALLYGGHDVHILTGIFLEAGEWQSLEAKKEKLGRIGILFETDDDNDGVFSRFRVAKLHGMEAVDQSYPLEYRLRDLGLRKGALCEKLGIDLFIDDSTMYCEMVPKMNGYVTVLQVH